MPITGRAIFGGALAPTLPRARRAHELVALSHLVALSIVHAPRAGRDVDQ